jgi:heme O synthase-like polyprenyltransferase
MSPAFEFGIFLFAVGLTLESWHANIVGELIMLLGIFFVGYHYGFNAKRKREKQLPFIV